MESTALLVIDEQLGAFDGKIVPAIYEADQLLERSQKLIEAARASGIPVIFIQHCASEGLLVEGTEAWTIHPTLAPQSNEKIILKQESSAFEATELQDVLDGNGIQTVITCGLQSEHCVSNTAFGAIDLGLNVYVAGDSHSTWATEDDAAEVIIEKQNQVLVDRGALVHSAKTLVELMAS